MTDPEWIRETAARLERAGVPDPVLEADLLDAPLAGLQAGRARMRMARWTDLRCAGLPWQYAAGRVTFRGLPIRVGPGVLIPRPETEILVGRVVAELDRRFPEGAIRIADIGTGTGCVALAIARERPRAHVDATDRSAAALAWARRNARHLEVRIGLHEGDLLAALPEGTRYHAIVSNPPYVAESERETLQPEVRLHEPPEALFAGGDGLAVIRRLLREAPPRLVPGGFLAIEIGYNQARDVERIAKEAGWASVHIHADEAGIGRVIIAG